MTQCQNNRKNIVTKKRTRKRSVLLGIEEKLK